jgi:pantothenate kinase-related protein Tda10
VDNSILRFPVFSFSTNFQNQGKKNMSNSLKKVLRRKQIKNRKITKKQFKDIAKAREERIKLYEQNKEGIKTEKE